MSHNAVLPLIVDTTKLDSLMISQEVSSRIIEEKVNLLVDSYCEQLDKYIEFVQDLLNDLQQPPTNTELDDFALTISTLLYFAGGGQESLGIREDMAKAIKQELYNGAYREATGTISDKTAAAELESQYEAVVQSIYQRAFRKVKFKVEQANEVLQAIKKVITRRTSEYEMSKIEFGSSQRRGTV